MEICSKQATVKAPADAFTGDAWPDVMVRGENPPGSASASASSTLRLVRAMRGMRSRLVKRCTSPTAWAGSKRGMVRCSRYGRAIRSPPGEWHWHGPAPDHFMTHLAMWAAPADGPETEWGAQVSDEEYGAHSP